MMPAGLPCFAWLLRRVQVREVEVWAVGRELRPLGITRPSLRWLRQATQRAPRRNWSSIGFGDDDAVPLRPLPSVLRSIAARLASPNCSLQPLGRLGPTPHRCPPEPPPAAASATKIPHRLPIVVYCLPCAVLRCNGTTSPLHCNALYVSASMSMKRTSVCNSIRDRRSVPRTER